MLVATASANMLCFGLTEIGYRKEMTGFCPFLTCWKMQWVWWKSGQQDLVWKPQKEHDNKDAYQCPDNACKVRNFLFYLFVFWGGILSPWPRHWIRQKWWGGSRLIRTNNILNETNFKLGGQITQERQEHMPHDFFRINQKFGFSIFGLTGTPL